MKNIKFEHIFAIILLLVISAAMFIFAANEQLSTTFATALVGGLSSITAFFFTKHKPEDK